MISPYFAGRLRYYEVIEWQKVWTIVSSPKFTKGTYCEPSDLYHAAYAAREAGRAERHVASHAKRLEWPISACGQDCIASDLIGNS